MSPWLYLNRCTGGCREITGGSANDAMAGVTEENATEMARTRRSASSRSGSAGRLERHVLNLPSN